MWSVRVDADTGTDFDEGLSVHLQEQLAGRHPAAGASYLASRHVPGRVSVQLSVEESTARRAIDTAVREVTAALRAYGHTPHIARIEALPEEELDEHLDALPVELMGMREIAVLLDVSRQRADQISKRPDFPQALAELASGSIWPGAAVRRWATTWERKKGRPRTA